MSIASLDWGLRAACRDEDPSLFFSPDDEGARARGDREREARAVCRRCPVRGPCLEFAAEQGIWFGVWGGVNLEHHRKRTCGNNLHLMTFENTWVGPDGHRNCRACRNAADRRDRDRRREQQETGEAA
jgi:WhiB family redox-sensing transcriptional regulator